MHIDQIIRSRRRTIALVVPPDGRLIVRAPLHASLARINALVDKETAWIETHQAERRATYGRLTPHHYQSGEKFLYLGQEYPLRLVPGTAAALRLDGEFIMPAACCAHGEDIFSEWYRNQAKTILTSRVEQWAQRMALTYQSVKITSARTRWGSCSRCGSICFSWRLIMAPMDVIDYVIVHELAHRVELNHSNRFWAEVARSLPDYRQHVSWLKANGHRLCLDPNQ
jgi:predicted metal-dependent hydrolase